MARMKNPKTSRTGPLAMLSASKEQKERAARRQNGQAKDFAVSDQKDFAVSRQYKRGSKYDPDFCAKVYEIGAEGGGIAEMAEACGVHRTTLQKWTREYPEFGEALERAKQACQVKLEKLARAALLDGRDGARFPHQLWSRMMAAQFPDQYTETKREERKVTIDQGEVDKRQLARAIKEVLDGADKPPMIDVTPD